jgi:hypothetical protein
VLVWAEQGIGDELLFASHLGLLAERCDRLCYECDPRLRPLLERSFPDVLFFDRSAGQARVPTSFDAEYQCAAGDIIRYLNPELEIEAVAFRALATDGKQAGTIELPKDGRLVIGLSYHTGGSNALHRLPPPDFWDVFLEFRDRLVLIDLQSNRARSFTPPQTLRDSGLLQQVDQLDLYNNFDELAALLGELDHVITIDNAIAHLAGTRHCSAILLLSAVHDWRWLRGTERLPWYPATRMIRQPRHGDWDSVQRSLRGTLRGLVTN